MTESTEFDPRRGRLHEKFNIKRWRFTPRFRSHETHAPFVTLIERKIKEMKEQ